MVHPCLPAVLVIVAFVSSACAYAGPPPGTDEKAWKEALALAKRVKGLTPPPFEPTMHPDAQWYPRAGFGLFLHWGIHSIEGVQPSWAMIKDYPYGGELYPPERYYAQAECFDPQAYDPDLWMAAAKRAGFAYAVLTAKHHDGYALWPTAFGDMGTRQYMRGRDLLTPYVEACRRHGLKVGFYFSPRDWHYPGFPLGDIDFDHNKRNQRPPIEDPEEDQRRFDEFYAYTLGQLNELLTRYGVIDVLWFDGMGWHGISDVYEAQTLAWVRSLQPGIVINDRWGRAGDFTTPEWDLPEGRPLGWWENCISWNGHWGYNRHGLFRSVPWVLDRLVTARSWGGNFLLNVGPTPNGTMQESFYKRCDELAAWMATHRDSVVGAGSSPGDARANVPVTTRGNTWYLHVLCKHEGAIDAYYVEEPQTVSLMRSGAPLPYSCEDGRLRVEVPERESGAGHDVIVLTWTENSWEKTIRRFEEQDREKAPPGNAVLFVGSSTIRMWDLDRWLPGLDTINRGFGGSQFADAAFYAERIILPYAPRAIVVYSGDNDVAHGKSAAWVFADFEALIHRIRDGLPHTPILVFGVKPSIARRDMWPTMRDVNARIAAYVEGDLRLTYIDGAPSLLGEDGRPRPSCYIKDGLHFNDEGYAAWTALVAPLLEE